MFWNFVLKTLSQLFCGILSQALADFFVGENLQYYHALRVSNSQAMSHLKKQWNKFFLKVFTLKVNSPTLEVRAVLKEELFIQG